MSKILGLKPTVNKINPDKRFSIAFIIDFLATSDRLTGGTEKQLIETINHLDQSKFRLIICCLQEWNNTPYWNVIKCEKQFLHVYSLGSLKGLKAFYSFVRFLKQNSIDIVQTFFHDSTLFGILAGRLAGVKKTISCRRDLGFWYDKKRLRNISFANRFTDRILVNSKAVKEIVVTQENFPTERIDVIHNGLDIEAFDLQPAADLRLEYPQIQDKDKVIGIVANYNRSVKRVDLFIKTAAEVAKTYPDSKFLIVGGGRLENDLKAMISNFGLEGRIILCGKKEPAIPYIKAFDIGVLTSDSEGFSNVLLEYMAAGIPVVATDVGGNQEIVENESLGFLVPRDDHLGLGYSIGKLLRDNSLSREIGRNARKHVEKNFSWTVRIKEIESYYENLLGR